MNILEELPHELVAIVLQYHLYRNPTDIDDECIACEPIKVIERVLNGPHRKSIIDSHTTTYTGTDILGYTYIKYSFKGQLHRENDQPAIEVYYRNTGNIYHRSWYINGQLHRENDQPAVESYYRNGNISYRYWYINEQLHRENDQPAYEEYFENGNVYLRSWYINGNYIERMINPHMTSSLK